MNLFKYKFFNKDTTIKINKEIKQDFIFDLEGLTIGRINSLFYNFLKLNDFNLKKFNLIFFKNKEKIKFYKKNYIKYYRNKNQKLKNKNIKLKINNLLKFNFYDLIKKIKNKKFYNKLINKLRLYVDK